MSDSNNCQSTVSANCPGCKGNVTWDWCQDLYVVGGKFCETIRCTKSEGDIKLDELSIFQCPECKTILGSSLLINDGYTAEISIPEFEGIDWDTPDNAT